jgi:nitric oxide reductase NorD protein
MEQVNVDRQENDSFDEDALYNAEDLDEITLGKKMQIWLQESRWI